MINREEILNRLDEVPSLPSMTIELLGLLQDPEVSMPAVIRALEHDPGMVANLLRVANSAALSGTRSVDSISQAINRLGTQMILNMSLSASMAPSAIIAVKGYNLAPGQLWERSVAMAVGAEQLAKALSLEAPGHAFTVGLLADVGKLALGHFLKIDISGIREIALEEGISFENAEYQVLGIDHAEVAAELLSRWKLPACIVEGCRYHHCPSKLKGDSQVADLVHIADSVSLMCGIGTGLDGLHYEMDNGAVKRLNISTYVLDSVAPVVLERLEEMRELTAETARG